MRLKFLLGPAGSGKTHRCRREILAELERSPEGPPLIWLAPKQATFQLERQLLGDPALPGYVRLYILSFERLAELLLELWSQPPPPVITEEGRVMVLRALLNRPSQPLEVFHASARLPGFARELSRLLRQLQYQRQSPEKLYQLASRWRGHPAVPQKLRDVVALQKDYQAWLAARRLQDPESLLDGAIKTLRQATPTESRHRLAGLWLDGFAELSPQEIGLLQALAPHCEQMTLAFCLESAPDIAPHWLSVWSAVTQVCRKCLNQLAPFAQETRTELITRDSAPGRFTHNPVLAHLERHWARPIPGALPEGQSHIRLVTCSHPEEEVILAARILRQHVRQGGRYRDCAVLARTLDPYHEAVRRIFPRCQIPFFLDRRESVAHHPLAELTRCALRLAAFDWRHEDWFGALKTGLISASEDAIDCLENEALARGWEGPIWRHPLPKTEGNSPYNFEKIRQQLVPAFLEFTRVVASGTNLAEARPDGQTLALALENLWLDLRVKETLELWSQLAAGNQSQPRLATTAQVHQAVWGQMRDWLRNVIQAFTGHPLSLREWLPIVESGLAELTVGVIPPALDQVLVGAVDRSRNPDLHTVIVLGLNESVFPAAPKTGGLFGVRETEELASEGLELAASEQAQLSLERYLAYIACTRARERVVLTWAATTAEGKQLNRSSIIGWVQRLFTPEGASPQPAIETFSSLNRWQEAEHAGDAIAALNQSNAKAVSSQWSEFQRLLPREISWDCAPAEAAKLPPAAAQRLFGNELRLGITSLEKYAACPFQFFVETALRASERREHELDYRQQGSFLHEALAAFHHGLQPAGRRWRDLAPAEARARIRQVATEVAARFQDGLLQQNADREQTTASLIEILEEFVGITVEWMSQYQFDPTAAELAFGFGAPERPQPAKAEQMAQAELFAPEATSQAHLLPAWVLPLTDGHRLALKGRIDRVDLYVNSAAEAACVVLDYKTGGQTLDPIRLANGLQLQLFAYLNYLRQLPPNPNRFGGRQLTPAGAFYLDLQGHFKPAKNRNDARTEADKTRWEAYRHRGRFSSAALRWLDNREGANKGTQFSYQITNKGEFHKGYSDPLSPRAFEAVLENNQTLITQLGEAIFRGEIQVDPYQHKNERACDRCQCQAICRIDPWTHPFRKLAQPAKAET